MWTPSRTKNKTCQRAGELPVSQRPCIPGEEIGTTRLYCLLKHSFGCTHGRCGQGDDDDDDTDSDEKES